MHTTTTVGLDIAKSVFQVHGIDADGNVVVRRQLKRRYVLTFFQKLPPCLVGIEACASSHYWSLPLSLARPAIDFAWNHRLLTVPLNSAVADSEID
jgi:transposase